LEQPGDKLAPTAHLSTKPDRHEFRLEGNWRHWWYHFARKTDGSVWVFVGEGGTIELRRNTDLDQVSFPTLSLSGYGNMAYVRRDGSLWMSWTYQLNATT
jgi:hypothetical protein